MNAPLTALETLHFLCHNHHLQCQQVDPGMMPPERLDALARENPPVRPFRILTWAARHGFIISAWNLWEYHTNQVCENLPRKVARQRRESFVQWAARSFTANGKVLPDEVWFTAANNLRNVIVHYGTRATCPEALRKLEQARAAFRGITTYTDGYVDITADHVHELQFRIEEFILNTPLAAPRDGNP
jgi:hypothetical protein